ncbi:hypothetical protein CLV83_2398 [Marinobacterium mangrovicola]|uniref:VanZ like protein n=1 Tax=Marinobacterium mangrovicola TaxID=1476959 RepID=A0A4R1GGE4_9GAMM|nr:hypothetical protein CLV83_2398 [Marinobacterium mangrovicola]
MPDIRSRIPLVAIGCILAATLIIGMLTDIVTLRIPNPFDKLIHLSLFVGLTIGTLSITSKRYRIVLTALVIIFALSSEAIQHIATTGREFSVYDSISNIMGVLIAIFYHLIFRVKKRSKTLLS